MSISSIGISITLYDSLINGEKFIDSAFHDFISSYSHTIKAIGGYDTASIDAAVHPSEYMSWMKYGLGRRIVTRSQSGSVIWEGFVNEISMPLGGLSLTIGPLTEIRNRIIVEYKTMDYNTNPPIPGVTAYTVPLNDTTSQGKYGIIEELLSAGEASEAEANQLASIKLAEFANPDTSQQIAPGGELPKLTLGCLGYWHWLSLYTYTSAVTFGTTDLAQKISDVLDAEPNNFISTERGYIDANALTTSVNDNESRTASEIIEELVSRGDASDNRYTFGIYNDRIPHYHAVPTDPEYFYSVATNTQDLTRAGGGIVFPWEILPARWVEIKDMPLGGDMPSVLRSEPRFMFIEDVTYTAPYDYNITGGKVSKFDQRIKRLGLGGSAI